MVEELQFHRRKDFHCYPACSAVREKCWECGGPGPAEVLPHGLRPRASRPSDRDGLPQHRPEDSADREECAGFWSKGPADFRLTIKDPFSWKPSKLAELLFHRYPLAYLVCQLVSDLVSIKSKSIQLQDRDIFARESLLACLQKSFLGGQNLSSSPRCVCCDGKQIVISSRHFQAQQPFGVFN